MLRIELDRKIISIIVKIAQQAECGSKSQDLVQTHPLTRVGSICLWPLCSRN